MRRLNANRSSARRHQRGVTLIELMVSVALLSIVLAGVITAFVTQNRLFSQMGSQRQAQSNARMAIATIQRFLGRAGYGIHPGLALDLGTGAANGWYCPTCVRDGNAGGGAPTDEIVFMARNPQYYVDLATGQRMGNSWDVPVGSGGTSLMMSLHDGNVLRKGEVVEIVCPGGYNYGYVTVANNVGPISSGGSDVDASVGMTGTVGTDPYQQDNIINSKCVTMGRAKAFAVDRYHFLVTVDNTDPNTPRPFLMLDRGEDVSGNGVVDAGDYQPVAADIEDLQFAYLMDDGSVIGDAANPGTPTAPNNGGNPCSKQITSIFYQPLNVAACPANDARRTTGATTPAVHAVRVTVVGRTKQPARGRGATANVSYGTPPLPHEDHAVAPVRDGYQREVLHTTVVLPNLDSRGVPIL